MRKALRQCKFERSAVWSKCWWRQLNCVKHVCTYLHACILTYLYKYISQYEWCTKPPRTSQSSSITFWYVHWRTNKYTILIHLAIRNLKGKNKKKTTPDRCWEVNVSIGEGKGFSRWLCRLCPVGTARTDVALFTAVSLDISVRACVCVKERGHEEDRQKERVRGREVCQARQTTQQDWFIWQLLDGGLTTRGHLLQCLTCDLLQLLKRTQLSLLNLQLDRRDEFLLGRTHIHKYTHKTHTRTRVRACVLPPLFFPVYKEKRKKSFKSLQFSCAHQCGLIQIDCSVLTICLR